MRLFIGLPLPQGAREAAFSRAAALQALLPGRYGPKENYHITLAFLGEVPSERVAAAEDVARRCAARFPAPHVTLGAPDHFAREGREDRAVLILRAQSDPPLRPLHDALVEALRAAALPAQAEPFAPHVTLARHADAHSLSKADVRPLGVAFTASRLCLYESARDAEGALRYTPLAFWPFSSPDGATVCNI